MNARPFLAAADLEARFFLAGADDVEAGPDEAGLLDDSPPPPPLLQLLPLPCRCSVAEVEGGATLREGGGTATPSSVQTTSRHLPHLTVLCGLRESALQPGLQLCLPLTQVPRLLITSI